MVKKKISWRGGLSAKIRSAYPHFGANFLASGISNHKNCSMTYTHILVEQKEQCAYVTINRPKQLNALNKATIAELHEAFDHLQREDSVRVIILTGAGEKAFVAGADIKEFSNFGIQEGTELAAQGQKSLFNFVENLSKPVIAAVNGFALGGGLELAMAAHLRIASHNANMGLPETSLGLIPGYGGTQRLTQLIGKGRAMEMITTAQMVNAEKAAEIGLVNEVCQQEELITYCENIAGKMIKNSPMAIESAIKAINAGSRSDVNGFAVEVEEFGKCFGTADFTEGVDAFLNKRKAQF